MQPNFDASDAVEFWDEVNRQDWRSCELAQLGVQSRNWTGVFTPQEAGSYEFNKWVLDQLNLEQ
jgi:Rieske 2Fe-2S family protein